MSVRPVVVAVGVAGLILLGAGGYFVNGQLKCGALEDDFLNNLDSARNMTVMRGLIDDTAKAADLERIGEERMKSAEADLFAVYEQCGQRAGGNAARKGSELLLGS